MKLLAVNILIAILMVFLACLGHRSAALYFHPVANNFEPHYTVFHGHTYITIASGVTIHDPDCEDRDLRDILNAHTPVKKVHK